MRLYQQLVLFMFAATVLPLAGVGFWLLSRSEQALAQRIGGEQRALATAAAQRTGSELLGAVDTLAREAEAIDWVHTSAEERKGALALLYQQSSAVSVVALMSPDGALLAGPVFTQDGAGGHPPFAKAAFPEILRQLPLGALRTGGRGQAALSPAFRARSGGAQMGLAIKLGDGQGDPFVVAGLGLAAIEAPLREQAPTEGRLLVVDGEGRVVASPVPGAPDRLASALWKAVQAGLGRREAASFAVPLATPLLVAAARVPDQLGLVAVVEVDQARALASVRRMRHTVLGSLGGSLAVLLLLGGAFTRRLNRRLGQVVDGAEAFGRGDLDRRIALGGSDELTELAGAFNRMGEELGAARARLLRWNDDLRQKVEEATAELRDAQAHLVEAQKLAAVGQLGAGVAHEINNPLAGILGHTQLLLLDRAPGDADFEALRKIEQSAKRCKEITQNLLRFSQQRDRPELRPIDLNAVARDAVSLTENQVRGEGITLELDLATSPVRVKGDPGHLSQVLLAFISNARTAMAQSPVRVLRIATRLEPEEDALVWVEDTGKGIAPEHLPRIFEPFFTTKDVWANVGLGLSVAYRISSEHQGRIEVATEVGKGSRFTLRLKALGATAAVTGAAAAEAR